VRSFAIRSVAGICLWYHLVSGLLIGLILCPVGRIVSPDCFLVSSCLRTADRAFVLRALLPFSYHEKRIGSATAVMSGELKGMVRSVAILTFAVLS